MKEKAILIGLITPDTTPEKVYEYLDELAFLAKTAGAYPIRNFTQTLKHPDTTTFL
jgi:GTP-binding protein HflX